MTSEGWIASVEEWTQGVAEVEGGTVMLRVQSEEKGHGVASGRHELKIEAHPPRATKAGRQMRRMMHHQ